MVLKTRDWRSYQITGFPEEGRVGVGLWVGVPALGVSGLAEGAHAAHPSLGDPSPRSSPTEDKQTPKAGETW